MYDVPVLLCACSCVTTVCAVSVYSCVGWAQTASLVYPGVALQDLASVETVRHLQVAALAAAKRAERIRREEHHIRQQQRRNQRPPKPRRSFKLPTIITLTREFATLETTLVLGLLRRPRVASLRMASLRTQESPFHVINGKLTGQRGHHKNEWLHAVREVCVCVSHLASARDIIVR